MTKNKHLRINRIFLVIALFVFLAGNTGYSQTNKEAIFKLNKVLSWVDNYYVDTVNQDQLIEEVIIEMLRRLDPHSTYISKEDVKAMNEPLHGNFEGIGIQFNILNDTIMVVSPISGGPSEKLGIQAGDRIVKIENEIVAGIGITTKGVRDRLLGKKGTKVNVFIKRRGVSDLLNFTITRDKIPIFSVDASYMIDNKIGYIKLNRFSATSMREFHKAMDKLENQGMKHLILDLKDNGGGYLNTAIELADEFLSKNKLIVYTEGTHRPKNEYIASDDGRFERGRLIVLINEGSASASEIVSGAIQDWDRGIVVGRRSFGKGLVQRAFTLPDGSMIRLTIARYYTPTGRCIQKPYDDGEKAYRQDIANRYNHGEMICLDSIHFPDSLKYFTKNNKRVVFGGGGIMPDIFIPLDTTLYSDYHRKLIRAGWLNRFALEYVDLHRNKLNEKYPDFKIYDQVFQVDNEILTEFRQYVEKNTKETKDSVDTVEKKQSPTDDVPDIENNENIITSDKISEPMNEENKRNIIETDKSMSKKKCEFEKAKPMLSVQLKALIARDLWSINEYYQIMNRFDESFLKAIELLQQKADYKDTLETSMFE